MRDHSQAFDRVTGGAVTVPSTYVDNPAIFGGRFVSKLVEPRGGHGRRKDARTKREPVEPEVADQAATQPEPGAAVADTKE